MKLKGLPHPPQCEHIKTNGIRCGSPAVRERKFCYFHQRARDLHHLRRRRPQMKLYIPLLEDANAVQIAIQQVAEAIAEDRIDNKRAGLLLFAFQTAASNLRQANFEPKELREVYGEGSQLTPIMELLARSLGLFEDELGEEASANAQSAPGAPASASEPAKKPPAPASSPESTTAASAG